MVHQPNLLGPPASDGAARHDEREGLGQADESREADTPTCSCGTGNIHTAGMNTEGEGDALEFLPSPKSEFPRPPALA